MSKSFAVVAFGIFVVGLVFDYLLYWIVLGNALANDSVLRAVVAGPWPKLIAGELVFSIAAAWIYARGMNSSPALGQGVRFGLALSFLFAVAGGLQIAPMIGASEYIIIGAIVGNAVKVLAQGITAGLLGGSGPARV